MVQSLVQSFAPGGKLISYTLPNPDEKRDPYTIVIRLTAPRRAKKTGNLLILPVANSSSTDRSNPFVKEQRSWPILIEDATRQRSTSVINLPEGFTVEETAENLELRSGLFHYRRAVSLSPDTRTLTIETTSEAATGVMPSSDYADVRSYYSRVDRASEDLIVLRRSTGG
jgi:hypothetical protein